jgi:hypothetical protein
VYIHTDIHTEREREREREREKDKCVCVCIYLFIYLSSDLSIDTLRIYIFVHGQSKLSGVHGWMRIGIVMMLTVDVLRQGRGREAARRAETDGIN